MESSGCGIGEIGVGGEGGDISVANSDGVVCELVEDVVG